MSDRPPRHPGPPMSAAGLGRKWPATGRLAGSGRWARRSVGAALALVGAVALSGCAISLQSLPKVSGLSAATYPIYADVLQRPQSARRGSGPDGCASRRTGGRHIHQGFPGRPDPGHQEVGPAAGRDDRPGPLRRSAGRRVHPPAGAADPCPRTADGDASQIPRPGAHIPESSTSIAPSVEDTFGRPLPRPQRRGDQPAPNHHQPAERHVQRKPDADPLVPDHHRRRRELLVRRQDRHRRRPRFHLEPEQQTERGRTTIANGISHDRRRPSACWPARTSRSPVF